MFLEEDLQLFDTNTIIKLVEKDTCPVFVILQINFSFHFKPKIFHAISSKLPNIVCNHTNLTSSSLKSKNLRRSKFVTKFCPKCFCSNCLEQRGHLLERKLFPVFRSVLKVILSLLFCPKPFRANYLEFDVLSIMSILSQQACGTVIQ